MMQSSKSASSPQRLAHPLLLSERRIPAWYRFGVKPLFLALSPVFVVLKLALGLPFLILSALTDYLLNLGTDPALPLPAWRYWIYRVVKAITYRMTLVALGVIPIKRGKTNHHVRAICANHQSSLDIMVVAGTGTNSSIAKAGIANNPLYGPTIRVTRSFLARAGQNLDQLATRLTEEPQRFPPLGVFPGGTTTNQLVQPRFRSGIFHNKPSVQIATLKYYTYENLFYVAMPGPKHLKNIFLNPLSFVVITYHPEVFTHQSGETAQQYADRIGAAIAQKTGGVYTNYTFKDCLWFAGNEQLREELSEEYKKDHLWRGNVHQWTARCRKAGMDPAVNWAQAEVEAAEK